MPGSHVKGKVEDNLVVWLRKQSLKDRHPTLRVHLAPLSEGNAGERAHLEDIFKIPCGHLLEQ